MKRLIYSCILICLSTYFSVFRPPWWIVNSRTVTLKEWFVKTRCGVVNHERSTTEKFEQRKTTEPWKTVLSWAKWSSKGFNARRGWDFFLRVFVLSSPRYFFFAPSLRSNFRVRRYEWSLQVFSRDVSRSFSKMEHGNNYVKLLHSC